jgi:hypothetical protein
LLPGDDLVLPNFYDAYNAVINEHPNAGTILGQTITVDESDRWLGLYGATPPIGGGILNDFVERQATWQLVLHAAVAVRRDAYERVGGFCTLFSHVTDWDMWFRLGQFAPVGCVSRPYALYRVHSGSDTSHSMVSALNIKERYFLTKINIARLNDASSTTETNAWRTRLAKEAEHTAWELDRKHSVEGRYNQIKWAWMLDPTAARTIVLLKSWLKLKLRRTGFCSPGFQQEDFG